MRKRTDKPKPQQRLCAIWVNPDQHKRYIELKALTGLHPRILFDRILDMAEAGVHDLVSIEKHAVSSGVRAAV